MVDSQHCVRFATTESRLELHDGLAPFSGESLGYLRYEERHAFCDKGAFVESHGVLIFSARLSGIYGCYVSGKFRLLERTFQNVLVGNSDFSPWLHRSFTPKQIVS